MPEPQQLQLEFQEIAEASHPTSGWSLLGRCLFTLSRNGRTPPTKILRHLWQSLEIFYSTGGIHIKQYQNIQYHIYILYIYIYYTYANWAHEPTSYSYKMFELRQTSLLQVDAGIRSADILMCSEPPFFCQMFLGRRLSHRPVPG